MRVNFWLKSAVAVGVILTFSGCGGDGRNGGGIGDSPTKSVSTTVTLGNPVIGSTCKISPFNNRGNVLDTESTDSMGTAPFEIPTDTDLAFISCSGGDFTPKNTAGTLESFLAPDATSAQTNPLTTIVAAAAKAAPEGTFTSFADLSGLASSVFAALGLPASVTLTSLTSGSLSGETLLEVNVLIIALANNPTLATTLAQQAAAGYITAATAAALNVAISETIAALAISDPSAVPVSPPVATGGEIGPTGGTGGA